MKEKVVGYEIIAGRIAGHYVQVTARTKDGLRKGYAPYAIHVDFISWGNADTIDQAMELVKTLYKEG